MSWFSIKYFYRLVQQLNPRMGATLFRVLLVFPLDRTGIYQEDLRLKLCDAGFVSKHTLFNILFLPALFRHVTL